MNFACAGEARSALLDWFVAGLCRRLEAQGRTCVPPASPDLRLVLNLITPERPRPFRRKAQATFVVAVAETAAPVDDSLRFGYPLMVRSLANLLILLVRRPGGLDTRVVTLEQGAFAIAHGGDDDAYFAEVCRRVAPLADSHLVINNAFEPDLEEPLWQGDEVTAAIHRAGRRLAELDLLPAPFPIQEILPARDLRHVQRLYGIGGLSYGNLSARKDRHRFWMSASGVNKADLREVGQHVLLIKGYDPGRNAMVLSVPPHVTPRRVSVDAIEHWMIYSEHPQVGAILHIHAWMDGIRSTDVNYPCGTVELARTVAQLVREAPDPARAVVGLKNHGLTITGHSLDEIFARIDGKIIRQVPMS